MIPRAILEQHTAVLGKTRSGKSSAMRLLVEMLLTEGEPVCIVDPKGDWWGIKLARDGRGPGFPVVIFGGERADVPINAHAGAHVAELFATGNRPCLVDLGGWMVGERTRFWIDFASALFRHTKGNRWLVVDEIHNFAPKGKIMDPDSGKALHWTNRLASEGLGKGLHMLFASQRPQKVHNDTLTSAETLIAMRVLHPSDRAAVSDWIKGCGDIELGNKVLNSLAQMGRGEGWAWSPEIGFGPERVKFPLFKTYDSFRPQSADDAKGLKGWAEVDLDEVKAKLAVVVKEAEENDPKRLKTEIVRLTRELAGKGAAGTPVTDAAAIEAARREGYERGLVDKAMAERVGWDRGAKKAGEFAAAALAEIIGVAQAQQANLAVELARALPPEPSTRVEIRRELPKSAAPIIGYDRQVRSGNGPWRAAPNGSGKSGRTGAELRILKVLAQRHPARFTMAQWATLAGMKRTGGTWQTYVSRLRSAGYLDEGGGQFGVTREGIAAAGAVPEQPQSSADVIAMWKGALGTGPSKILDELVSAYPRAVDRETLADRAGMTASGGTFQTYLSRLSGNGLIERTRDGVRASEALFG